MCQCAGCSVLLVLLQRDGVLLAALSPANRATPTVMAALACLVAATLARSRLWGMAGAGSIVLGVMEVGL